MSLDPATREAASGRIASGRLASLVPRDEGSVWRGADTFAVVTVWFLFLVQQLAVSLSRPKEFVPITEGGYDVPGWAGAVTTATNAGVLLLAVVLGLRWLRRGTSWDGWVLLLVALAPWVVVVARLVVLDRTPGPTALVYPAVVLAVWCARPRLTVAEVVGHLTVATAGVSVLLGILAPTAGVYARAAGAELEKPIGPFGVLAGVMLSGNDLGLVLAIGAASVWTIRRAVVRWAGLVLVLVAVVWSASRTALLALAVVALLALALRLVRTSCRPGPFGRDLAAVLAGASLAVLGLVMVLAPLLVRVPTALNNRGRLWAFAIERFGEDPLLGAGADVFKVIATTGQNLGGHATHAHNLAAQVLVSGGVLLVVALGALLVLAALRAVRHSANGWDWPVLFLAGFLVLAALEVPLVMTDRLRQYPYVLVPLLVVLLAQPAAARSSSSSAAE